MTRPWNVVVVLALAAGAAFALVSPGAHAQPSPQKVTLRLDWTVLGYHAPFYYGRALGHYRDAGIDLDIQEGKGSSNSITLVGHGSDDFAFADATTAARLAGEGLPVKTVMGIFRKSTLSLFFPRSKNVATGKDLKGKTVSFCAGDGLTVYLAAYMELVGLAKDDVKTAMLDCSAKYVAVPQGIADGVASYGTAGRALLAKVNVPDSTKLDYADAGLHLPSHGIVASTKKIDGQADLVRRFVRATAKAWEASLAEPDKAFAAEVAAVPLLKGQEALLKSNFTEAVEYLNTPGTRGKPFGYQPPDEWAAATEILKKYVKLNPAATPETFYTNAFIAQ
jgi:NitT/TauT family transport system substrate-binding protein